MGRYSKHILTILTLGILFSAFAPDPEPEEIKPPVWFKTNDTWVDSVFHSLTMEERIAQMIMVPAYSNHRPDEIAYVENLVRDYNIGGVLFFQGGPVRQAHLTNRYQKAAKTPLMIAMDAEYGLNMRLDSTIKFPYQMTTGAIQDDSLVYEMGKDIAVQLDRLGVHINLGPVVDVNNNRNNPVINHRSFGEDRDNVTNKGLAYMRGIQEMGVLANAKHFPGHGDTDADSHKTLPVVHHSRERLDSLELYPFKRLMKQGLGSMMVAHMYIPALDSVKNRATTMSPPVVRGLLRNELKYEGLIFSDALNMREITAFYEPGQADVQAVIAGNDVLLFVKDVPTAIEAITEAVKEGRITEDDINTSCRRILRAKAWMGLDKPQEIKVEGLMSDLNHNRSVALNHRLNAEAVTLLKDDEGLVPVRGMDTLNIAVVSMKSDESPAYRFHQSLQRYGHVDVYETSLKPGADMFDSLKRALEPYNLVVVSIHSENRMPYQNFGVTRDAMNLVDSINKEKKVILDVFANPYSLRRFKAAEEVEALVMSYEDAPDMNDLSAQLIFGAIPAHGKLPVTASDRFPLGAGIHKEDVIRMQYTVPEYLGISTEDLKGIETIVNEGIAEQAFPGCQVFIAKEGKVIYERSFGYHTYDKKLPVANHHVYDVASVTKIASSTASLMKLSDQQQFCLDSTLGCYVGDWVDSTSYRDINIRDMMAHQAGLISWIPFYIKTLHKGKPRFDLYSVVQNEVYDTRVAEGLYIRSAYQDSVIDRIVHTPLGKSRKYKYSDLGYYFIQEIIQRQSGLALNDYVDQHFYHPMGLQRIGYLPREWTNLNEIVPTENDLAFRNQLIHGDVHDPGAAMLGGVGGHAGLFSNANNLGVMMQMFVNKGHYGGKRFITDSTVNYFTTSHYLWNNNRRGVGFDKPVRNGSGGPTCNCVSLNSFGHSGFTGTLAWADPDEEVVYVFLSNRVYPDASNRLLITKGHRTRIQSVIYDALHKAGHKSH